MLVTVLFLVYLWPAIDNIVVILTLRFYNLCDLGGATYVRFVDFCGLMVALSYAYGGAS